VFAAVILSGCAGGAGGSSADDEGEGTIALQLAPVTSSRSARAAGEWSTASGTFEVSIEARGYSYSDSASITLSPGSPRSVTFKSVPVGITVTISATFTGTFEGIPESKTYTDSVTKTITSGRNVITLNPRESGGGEVVTELQTPVATVTCTGSGWATVPGAPADTYYVADDSAAVLSQAKILLSTTTSQPAGTVYKWFVGGGSSPVNGTDGSTSSSYTYDFGSWAASSIPINLIIKCKVTKDGQELTSNSVTLRLRKVETIPDFTISAASANTSSVTPHAGGGWDVPNLTDAAVKLTAISSGGSFPAGTTFEWKCGTETLPGTGASIDVSASQLGAASLSTDAPYEVSIYCTARNPGAGSPPVDGTGQTVTLYKKWVAPSSITVTKGNGRISGTFPNEAAVISFSIGNAAAFSDAPAPIRFKWVASATNTSNGTTGAFEVTSSNPAEAFTLDDDTMFRKGGGISQTILYRMVLPSSDEGWSSISVTVTAVYTEGEETICSSTPITITKADFSRS